MAPILEQGDGAVLAWSDPAVREDFDGRRIVNSMRGGNSADLPRKGNRLSFNLNDPFDRDSAVQVIVPKRFESKQFMESIRSLVVPSDAIALWYLGQNGFIVKSAAGPLVGIDLYLSNSCGSAFPDSLFRTDRQLPIFIEPEDLDVDVFITTHSHQDHADPETIARLEKSRIAKFVGPADSMRVYQEAGVDPSLCVLTFPANTIDLGTGATLSSTFALPTDNTDLNHTGVLLRFGNGMTFYNTGDTAYSDELSQLLPVGADVCAICMNGGFRNLSHFQAATIIRQIHPRFVVPCHYDMMVNNVACPDMLRVAMSIVGASDSTFVMMDYYEPRIFPAAAKYTAGMGQPTDEMRARA